MSDESDRGCETEQAEAIRMAVVEEERCSTWSVVVQAQGSGPRARAALGELFQRYERSVVRMIHAFWYPRDCAPEDLKQKFFEGVIRREDLQKLDRNRGVSFRGWLRVAVKNFLLNEKKEWQAKKRGNAVTTAVQFQALHGFTPELAFDRQFAEDTVLHALARHREEAKDKARFDLWACALPGPQLDIPDLAELATVLGKTRNGLAVEIHRLRKRHRQILREVIADTLDIDASDPRQATAIELEMRLLYRTLCEDPPMQVLLEDA